MQFQFFTIPIHDPQRKTEELNRFLTSHPVTRVRRELVEFTDSAFWVISVEYIDSPSPASESKKSKVDYRAILSEKDFTVFSQLRNWRKESAEKEGVPLYTLFTNEQLADIVRANPKSAGDLEQIEGVGEVRIKKYAEDLIKIVQNQGKDETSG